MSRTLISPYPILVSDALVVVNDEVAWISAAVLVASSCTSCEVSTGGRQHQRSAR